MGVLDGSTGVRGLTPGCTATSGSDARGVPSTGRGWDARNVYVGMTTAKDAVLVEGCGMCGTDYEQYVGAMAASGLIDHYPVVPGHEPVGRIELLSSEMWAASGLEVLA